MKSKNNLKGSPSIAKVKRAKAKIVHTYKKNETSPPYEWIAKVIVEVLKSKGECFPSDLIGRGLSQEVIKHHWAMSYALAKVELSYMSIQ